MSPSPAPVITLPHEAKVHSALGDEVTVLLSGEQTGGAFAMMQIVTPPGGGPPPHCHTQEDEWFYVVEGHVEFWRDGVWTEVPVGSSVFLPRGSHHTFRNCGDSPLRLIVHTAPAGFEIFFERIAEVFNRPGEPDMQRIIEIAGEHGIEFLPSSE